jgi:ABC-type phosphate transport system auxiliary subunit
MSYEAEKALDRIVALCEKSDNLTGRQIRIFDIALEGLGMVAKQREEITGKWRQAKITARRARWEARQAAELAA